MKCLLLCGTRAAALAAATSLTLFALQSDIPVRVTVSTEAPIYVSADASRVPIRVAKVGTALNVIATVPGWYQVEFNDPQWGRRVGFVEQKHVEQRAMQESALVPMDLSVPATGAAPPTLRADGPPTATPAPGTTVCRVYVTEQSFPPGYFRKIKDVKWARKWYGGAQGGYQKLADEGWKVDADAVIQVDISYRPSGFSWASAHAIGVAIKWTEEGRRHFGDLKGQCYDRSSK